MAFSTCSDSGSQLSLTSQDSWPPADVIDVESTAKPIPIQAHQPSQTLLSLYHWPECSALVCTACKADEPLGGKTLLCKGDVLAHLRDFHRFTSDSQAKALNELLDTLSPLAQTPDEFERPISGRPPRGFLAAPEPQWCCSYCGFIAQSEDVFAAHMNYRHYRSNIPRRIDFDHFRTYVQRADDFVFSVVYSPPKPESPTSTEHQGSELIDRVEPHIRGLPNFLQLWPQCRAIVCTACDGRPLLCKSRILSHLQDAHDSELGMCEQLSRDLSSVEILAANPGDILPPLPYLPKRDYLNPPEKGYVCAAFPCRYAHKTLESVIEHEIQQHSKLYEKFEERIPVLVQMITLEEPHYFAVLWEKENDAGETPLFPIPRRRSFPAATASQWEDRIPRSQSSSTLPVSYRQDSDSFMSASARRRGIGSTRFLMNRRRSFSSEAFSIGNVSIESIGNMTFQSALPMPGPETKDSYTHDERHQILKNIYTKPKPTDSDLAPLNEKELSAKIRALAYRDGPHAIQEARKFTRPLMHAILRVQHKIVSLEEKNSWGLQTELRQEALEHQLVTYAKLIRAYQDLTSCRQPSKDRTRAFGRFFATELREPRYWYDPDALDLIDLSVAGPRQSTDSVRVFLQKNIPARFLDKEGRERRALDEMKKKKELPGGGMTKIIDAHRRNGRYISPVIDKAARILFALVGGVLLLTPMIAMTFIEAKQYLLLTTVLFVLLFAVSVAFTSNVSNQELLAVTAAYAAVLVVFVGNAIGNNMKPTH